MTHLVGENLPLTWVLEFCHPAWTVSSYSNGPPAAGSVGIKSTGSLHQQDGSPWRCVPYIHLIRNKFALKLSQISQESSQIDSYQRSLNSTHDCTKGLHRRRRSRRRHEGPGRLLDEQGGVPGAGHQRPQEAGPAVLRLVVKSCFHCVAHNHAHTTQVHKLMHFAQCHHNLITIIQPPALLILPPLLRPQL